MKLDYKRTILCSLAFGWIALFWGSYDSFMQIVDKQVFGLNEIWHGLIVATDNILGLLLLPLFGKLSDISKQSRFGKRKPYIVFGTVIEMVFFAGVIVFSSLAAKNGVTLGHPDFVKYFVPFACCLFITLASMAAYRSPALALVPDVTAECNRSQANAISNIVSVITTVFALVFFAVFIPKDLSKGFWWYGLLMLATTAILLIWFILTVNENKYAARLESEIDTFNKANNSAQIQQESTSLDTSATFGGEADPDDTLLHLPNIDDKNLYKTYQKPAKSIRENVTFTKICVLGVVFCFYMAYNAITSFFILYAEYILGFARSQAIIPIIVMQVAAMISFPLSSWLANKIGRRNCILIGFVLMLISFGVSIVFNSPHPAIYVVFILLGVSFGLAMVNIYPFFLENTALLNIGKDTGVFSVSMTVAMAITPIIAGALIVTTRDLFGGGENDGYRVLFPYCMLFLAFAVILTLLIKSKKSKPVPKVDDISQQANLNTQDVDASIDSVE